MKKLRLSVYNDIYFKKPLINTTKHNIELLLSIIYRVIVL